MRTTKQQLRAGKPSIDDMREDLAEQEAMNMNVGDIVDMLIDGYEGLSSLPDIEIRDEWNALFGEKGSYGEESS